VSGHPDCQASAVRATSLLSAILLVSYAVSLQRSVRLKASKMEVEAHSKTTVLTNYEEYGSVKKFKILELAADDDDGEMSRMAATLQSKSSGKCEGRASAKDAGAVKSLVTKIGCDYLFITGHSSFHDLESYKIKPFEARKMGGIALDELASALVHAICSGGVRTFEFWCCECGLSSKTDDKTGDEHKRFGMPIQDKDMRELGSRISKKDYSSVSSLEYVIYRIHTLLQRDDCTLKISSGQTLRFIGLNGVGCYGASDTRMRTYNVKSHHDLEDELTKLQRQKDKLKGQWSKDQEAKLARLIEQFERHLADRKCDMVVYTVTTTILKGATRKN
jgi:hypothetical protein